MTTQYTHLTQEERYHISLMVKTGSKPATIARSLNRHRSTITREISRNKGLRGYRHKQAHKFAQSRKSKGNHRITDFCRAYMKKLIQLDWSPEQINGRLRKLGWKDVPCIETIYQFIIADKKSGGTLYKHLRCQKKRRKRYGSGQQRRGQINFRLGIEHRPKVIEQRTRIGDFEGDTVVGAGHKGVLLTLVDRTSRLTIIRSHKNRLAKTIAQSTINALKDTAVESITFDNGKEFAKHQIIAQTLKTEVYFADPYASWQRGTNENTNGLIRQYLKKSEPLDNVCKKKIQWIEERLNSRPRKTLGFSTPLEIVSRNSVVAL